MSNFWGSLHSNTDNTTIWRPNDTFLLGTTAPERTSARPTLDQLVRIGGRLRPSAIGASAARFRLRSPVSAPQPDCGANLFIQMASCLEKRHDPTCAYKHRPSGCPSLSSQVRRGPA